MGGAAQRWHRRGLAVALIFGAAAFVLFLVAAREEDAGHWTSVLYDAIAFLGFETPADALHSSTDGRLVAARVFVALFALLGVSGLIFEFFLPARDAARRVGFWFLRKLPGRSPAVVIGLGAVGAPLAREIRGQGRPVYAIALEESQALEEARQNGVLAIASALSAEVVRRRACLAHASEVFISTGDDIRNIEIAGDLLRDIHEGRTRRSTRAEPLACYLHASDPGVAAALATHRLLHDPNRQVVFHGFNLQQQTARDLLLDPTSGMARRHHGGGVPYYVLFGFGSMGRTISLQIARLAHFRTFRRVRMTIADSFGPDPLGAAAPVGSPARDLREFLDRYPGFGPDPGTFDMLSHRALDLPDKDGWGCRHWRPAATEWRSDDAMAVEYATNAEFLDVPSTVDAPGMVDAILRRLEPLVDAAGRPLPHEPRLDPVLVLCCDEERRNFEGALALRQAFESARFDGRLSRPLPLYVYLRNERGLATVLERAPECRFSEAVSLQVFGLRQPGDLYRQIARLEVRAMARVVQESYNAHHGGAEEFDALSPSFQASNIDAAAHADIKLDAVGLRRRPARRDEALSPLPLTSDEVETLAHMEHNRWMAERLTSGWRIGERRERRAGPIRIDNRRRPSFVPWSTLTAEQQGEKEKDVTQVLALNTIFWRVGQVVERIAPGAGSGDGTGGSIETTSLRQVGDEYPTISDAAGTPVPATPDGPR